MNREFTDQDKDAFLQETFGYVADYFQMSLDELMRREPTVSGDVRRIDAKRFEMRLYRDGRAVSSCTISLTNHFASRESIGYSSEVGVRGGYNHVLGVSNDEQKLFFETSFSPAFGGRTEKLTEQGVAEMFWSQLMEPLQRPQR